MKKYKIKYIHKNIYNGYEAEDETIEEDEDPYNAVAKLQYRCGDLILNIISVEYLK